MATTDIDHKTETDIAASIFSNAPNMLVLCLTVIGLIKIYTRFEKITTLADNFLAVISMGYLVATIVSYLALRATASRRRDRLVRAADLCYLFSLASTAALAFFVTFSLAG